MKNIGLLFVSLVLCVASACQSPSLLDNPGVSLPEQKETAPPSPEAIALEKQAVNAFLEERISQGNLSGERALSLLDEAIRRAPDYHQAYATKGGFLLALKRYSEAVQAFEGAVRIRPHVGEYWMAAALAHHKNGDEEKAKQACRSAIAAFNLKINANPDDPARHNRAFAVYLLGEKKAAVREIEKILKKNPEDVTAKILLESMTSDTGDAWELFEPHSGPVEGTRQPRFEDYAVGEKFSGTPAKPILTDPEAGEYKTRIADAARGQPDFAGHFTVARWGCGSGCVMSAIIDAKTGKVFMLPFTIIMGPGTGSEALTYKPDSSLFIVNGSRGEEDEAIGPFYYRWDGKNLLPATGVK